MVDIDDVIAKIRRIRAQGEKPKMKTFLGLPFESYSCEICGKATKSIVQCPYCGRWVGVTELFYRHKKCWDNAYGCCKICSDFIKDQLGKVEEVMPANQSILDPYLVSVREKFLEVGEYFKGRRFSWGPVVILLFEAVMLTLQRIIIDKKGVKSVEQLRKEKKLYFDILVKILEREGVKVKNIRDLEILKDLRNKVEHEGFKPSKEDAVWAYNTAKNFISQYYPKIFIFETKSSK